MIILEKKDEHLNAFQGRSDNSQIDFFFFLFEGIQKLCIKIIWSYLEKG